MPTPNPPSLLWGTFPATPPAIDRALQQDATFDNSPGAHRLLVAYQDSQILAASTHVVQSLVSGLTGTYVRVDPQSPAIQIGQWVCLSGSLSQTVTLAVLPGIALAGLPMGIALTAGSPGGICRIAVSGLVPPMITGLIVGGNLYAIVNTATGFTSTVASIGSNNYPVGTVDGGANLNVKIQLPPAPGGVGLTVAGTGFWPVINGVPGSNARAVNLGSSIDVTGLLPALNGGRLQGDLNITHAIPGTFDPTHQVGLCDTSTGTCQANFPLASAFPGGLFPTDWQVLVVDTAGLAGTSAITVNPNGSNVWDPNAFAFVTSNITLRGSGVVGLWQWDTNKAHFFLVNSTAFGGADVVSVGDDANVTITDTTHNQLVGFENLTAPRTCNLPTSPSPGQRITVADTDGTCSVANVITLNTGGTNPIGTTTVLTYSLSSPYETVVVEWFVDVDDVSGIGIWIVVDHVVGISKNTPVRLSATTTLTSSQSNIYTNTTAASFTITMPAAPADGQRVSFYDESGQWSNHGLTVAANTGQTILDVQNPIPTFGASTTLIQRYSSVVFEFDGVLTQWHT